MSGNDPRKSLQGTKSLSASLWGYNDTHGFPGMSPILQPIFWWP